MINKDKLKHFKKNLTFLGRGSSLVIVSPVSKNMTGNQR